MILFSLLGTVLDHLAQIMELLGEFPKDYCRRGKFASDYFNSKGRLRHINRLKFWPLPEVLREKYHFSEGDSQQIADFLLPMLRIHPNERATAADMLKHGWISDDPIATGNSLRQE